MVQEVVRRFWLGLLIGAVVGAGGSYAALERPWSSGSSGVADAPDAGPAVAHKRGKRKAKRRGKRRVAPTGDDIPALSAADRKLRWKGPAVKLPPRDMDFSGGEDARPLSPGEINDVIRNRSQRVVECIESARGNAPLKTAITLKLLVDGGGGVKKVRVRAPAYLFDHGFFGCARKAASRMRFPATGAHTVVDAPYDLY